MFVVEQICSNVHLRYLTLKHIPNFHCSWIHPGRLCPARRIHSPPLTGESHWVWWGVRRRRVYHLKKREHKQNILTLEAPSNCSHIHFYIPLSVFTDSLSTRLWCQSILSHCSLFMSLSCWCCSFLHVYMMTKWLYVYIFTIGLWYF